MKSPFLPVIRVLFLVCLLNGFAKPAFSVDTTRVDADVAKAIARVYPALVQINVVMVYYEDGKEKKTEGAGSGVIISSDGYVITNHHVAGKATNLQCILSSREELPAKLVGTDPLSDISILKLDLSARTPNSPPLPVASFGNSTDLKIGDIVLAMGCPLALSHSVTKGIVANKDLMSSRFGGDGFVLDGENVGSIVKWIGHDAQIQPGNSGGPLVNLSGEVIGINEIGMGTLSGAIPSDIAKEVSREIIKNGKVKRSWIGVYFQPLLKTESPNLKGVTSKNPDTPGVLVGGIIPGGPAQKAGLQVGDVVIAVDDTPVKVHFREEIPPFHLLLYSKPVGSSIQFKVLRVGKELTISIKSQMREDALDKEIEVKEWGFVAENITPNMARELKRKNSDGVILSSLRPGSPSDQATPPLTAWDIIVKVNDTPIPNMDALLKITDQLTQKRKVCTRATVSFERRGEHLISVVEVGIRETPDPTAEAQKPWLPIATQVVSKKLATSLGIKGKKGVRITEVYPDDTTKEPIFKVGDILTHIDGNLIEASELQDTAVFDTMIRNYRIGSEVEITGIRDGKPLKITTILHERPRQAKEFSIYENIDLEFKAHDISYFDRIKNQWSKEETGALVSEVERGGWASVSDLNEGDLIQEMNGQKITNIADLEGNMKKLQQQKSNDIVFLVKRGIHTFYLEFDPTWSTNSPSKQP